jgi:hypothetical protein
MGYLSRVSRRPARLGNAGSVRVFQRTARCRSDASKEAHIQIGELSTVWDAEDTGNMARIASALLKGDRSVEAPTRRPSSGSRRSPKRDQISRRDMKIGKFLSLLMLVGCYGSNQAPDSALGTYGGVVSSTGPCPSPAAELTVTVMQNSAYGEWYVGQQTTQFACAWVNQAGFFSSHRAPQGELEYVIGYFANGGSGLDARIDTGNCSYAGRLSKAQPAPGSAQRASASAQTCATSP